MKTKSAEKDRSYQDKTYGDTWADVYDACYDQVSSEMLDVLADLAGEGPALELGIGTGRVALPLAERGLIVEGIDASREMVRRLKAKKGGRKIPVKIGSFADIEASVSYQLVYVVFNTFFALMTQEEQVRCFESVATTLKPGGFFLLETFVPDLYRFQGGQTFRTISADAQEVHLEASTIDIVTQRINTQVIMTSNRGTRLFPVQLRFAWPSEIDLMGRIAGFNLHSRWSDWSRTSFTAGCRTHISVFQKPTSIPTVSSKRGPRT